MDAAGMESLWLALRSQFRSIIAGAGRLRVSARFLELKPRTLRHLFTLEPQDDAHAHDRHRIFQMYVKAALDTGAAKSRLSAREFRDLLRPNVTVASEGSNPAFAAVAGVRVDEATAGAT